MNATLRWASGRGPRNVTFKSVRPPDRATGRWDKVLELLLIKNLHTSRNFQQLQRFSIKSTNRRNYWDECHVEMVIRPGSLNFYFSIGSAAGLRDDVCLLYIDYMISVFLRNNFRTWQCIHNVSMIKMNITHEIVNQSQFSRLKIRTFRHENLCVLNTLQSHFPSLKTIISSRSPPHKVSNYVKNVPMWT